MNDTTTEWGVRMPDGDVEVCGRPGSDEDYTDEYVEEFGGVRVSRQVTEWREVGA